MQRAGANERYVGVEPATGKLAILDEAEQILVCRVVFADDRRMRLPAAIDQQIDRVPPFAAIGAWCNHAVFAREQQLMMFDQVASQSVDPLCQLSERIESVAQTRQQSFCGARRNVAVET